MIPTTLNSESGPAEELATLRLEEMGPLGDTMADLDGDLVNVYDQRNVLFYFYEYDRSPATRSGVSMFPILPTFGFEVHF